MSINFNAGMNQDYSYLFQGLSSNGSSYGNLNFLSDYAAIKNGSYGRLMKTYYGSASSPSSTSYGTRTNTNNVLDKIFEEKRNPTVSKEAQEANSNLTSGIASLKNTVATLQKDST